MSTLETPVSAQAQLLRAPARATRGPAEPARAHVVRWPALGSTALVAVAEREDLEAAVQIAERELAALDLACSRFRSDSELSRANACAGRPSPAGELLIEACRVALRGASLSGGLLDPTLGEALERAGYDRDWELLGGPDAQQPEREAAPMQVRARRRSGWKRLRLDPLAGTVTVPRAFKLDLGATAKALAADRACEKAHERLGHGVLVGLGGDLAAYGEPPAGGWRVHIADDHRELPGEGMPAVNILAGGLATSSTATRRWRVGAEQMHHIIDPRTGRPAVSRWRTVTVAAGSCVDANIASTTALLLDERAPAWLEQQGLPARLLAADGSVQEVAGWPRPR